MLLATISPALMAGAPVDGVAVRLAVGVVMSCLTLLEPGREVAAQHAQQLAAEIPGNPDADHAHDDLLVGSADVGIPDEVAESATTALAASSGDHLRGDDDLPRNPHADSGTDHDRRQGTRQHDPSEDVTWRGAHAPTRMNVPHID